MGNGIFPHIDLASCGTQKYIHIVAVVQGLLLAAGYGPSGLVDGEGRPDGKAGSVTLDLFTTYKADHGLDVNTFTDSATWCSMVHP